MVAITPGGEVVLARQYRPGPDTMLDEIPGGAVEAGEDVAAAARRELLEETGYAGHRRGDRAKPGCRARRGPAASPRSCGTPTRVSAPQNQAGEFCEVTLVSLAQFREHLRSGQLTDVDLGYLALDHAGLLLQ